MGKLVTEEESQQEKKVNSRYTIDPQHDNVITITLKTRNKRFNARSRGISRSFYILV